MRLFLTAALSCFCFVSFASELRTATPENVGMSSERLARITDVVNVISTLKISKVQLLVCAAG